MNIGTRGAKGKIGSMIQGAIHAKLEARGSHSSNGIAFGVPAAAMRWANSPEGRARNAAPKAPRKISATDRNRATLAALNAPKAQTAGERNRAMLATFFKP